MASKTVAEQIAIDSWNACRRDIYHLAEDMQNGYVITEEVTVNFNTPYAEAAHHFNRGYIFAAKTFARAFNSFEAIDADKMNEIFERIENEFN